MKNSFVLSNFEDPKTGVAIASCPILTRNKILDIGGSYNNKFAIVQE